MGIVDILSAPPGGLIYHLIVLFAIQAVFGMAIDEWQRHRQVELQRLVFAFGALLVARLLLMFAALVASQGWVASQNVIPPLERCLDLVSATLILYAFLPRENRLGQITRSACLINLALALIVYGVFAPLWFSAVSQSPLLSYNGYWQEYVWEVWQILLLVWGLIALRSGAVQQKVLVLSTFAVLLVGHVLHLWLHQGPPNVAGWERVANLIASALLVAATYRAVISDLVTRALESNRDDDDAQLRNTQRLYEEMEPICASVDLPLVLERATQSVLKVFEANLCAILLFDPRKLTSIQVAAVRRADGTYEAGQNQLELKSLPVVRRVLMRQRPVTMDAGSDDSPAWQGFLSAIHCDSSRTLTITPLLSGPRSVGVLIVDNAPAEEIALQAQGSGRFLTTLAGSAIAHAQLAQRLSPGTAKPRPQANEPAVAAEPRPVEPAVARPLEVAAAQRQLEQARRAVGEIEDTVRSLRAELAERNRQLAQLSQNFKPAETSAESGSTG